MWGLCSLHLDQEFQSCRIHRCRNFARHHQMPIWWNLMELPRQICWKTTRLDPLPNNFFPPVWSDTYQHAVDIITDHRLGKMTIVCTTTVMAIIILPLMFVNACALMNWCRLRLSVLLVTSSSRILHCPRVDQSGEVIPESYPTPAIQRFF